MLTFYYSPGACSLATHVTLEVAGADFTPQQVKLADGEQRTAAYLAINPRGRVPSLVLEDGTVLTENTAILTYLAHRFPGACLMPSDELLQIRSISLMAWFASGVHPIFTHVRRPERFATDPSAHADIVETAKRNFWACCQEIERTLGGREWFIGDRMSVCDLYSLVFYNWGYRIDLPMTELRAFTALKNRLGQRADVRRALQREESPLLQSIS